MAKKQPEPEPEQDQEVTEPDYDAQLQEIIRKPGFYEWVMATDFQHMK